MLRTVTLLFGLFFIGIGVAGYQPSFIQDGLLFGFFEVNDVHNMIHLASGVIALIAATRARLSKLFLQIFGLLYGATAIAGYWFGGDLQVMHVNDADNVLHAVIAVIALFVGFKYKAGR